MEQWITFPAGRRWSVTLTETLRCLARGAQGATGGSSPTRLLARNESASGTPGALIV